MSTHPGDSGPRSSYPQYTTSKAQAWHPLGILQATSFDCHPTNEAPAGAHPGSLWTVPYHPKSPWQQDRTMLPKEELLGLHTSDAGHSTNMAPAGTYL